ncbi:MAG: response regulator [Thermodesulfobacteriota bacterium]
MKEKIKWAFIVDKDEFVRLSLNKILKKYGFHVEEIEDFSQLERRKNDVKGGIILADVEIEVLERWLHMLRKWNDRFILMTPLVTDELTLRLKKVGIHRILKKPVEPRYLRRVIREISFPDEVKVPSLGKKGEGSRFNQKGGEDK